MMHKLQDTQTLKRKRARARQAAGDEEFWTTATPIIRSYGKAGVTVTQLDKDLTTKSTISKLCKLMNAKADSAPSFLKRMSISNAPVFGPKFRYYLADSV